MTRQSPVLTGGAGTEATAGTVRGAWCTTTGGGGAGISGGGCSVGDLCVAASTTATTTAATAGSSSGIAMLRSGGTVGTGGGISIFGVFTVTAGVWPLAATTVSITTTG